jgi:hypothetical protein
MSKKKLTIIYDGYPDKEMEKYLEPFLKKYGWKFVDGGTNLIDVERDLEFEKEEDE